MRALMQMQALMRALMRPLRLAAFELLRFRTPMQRAGLIFLALVPLLYGAIYLWSNWDPYGKLDRIPVAVVNEDRPVTVDGRSIDAGADFVSRLRQEPLLGWRFTGAAAASDGLKAGRYYAVITVPPDFSAKLSSGATGTPEQAAMGIRLDDANNYLVGIMAKTIRADLDRQISAAAVTTYFETVFAKLAELHGGVADAAGGAAELRDGLGRAEKGSGRLAAGLGTAEQGSAELASGLGRARQGSAALVDGLGEARQGTGALVGGLQRAGEGSGALVDGLGAAEDGTAALTGGLGALKQGTGRLAPGARRLSANLHALTGEAVPLLERASDALPDVAGKAARVSGDAARLASLGASRPDATLANRLDLLADRYPRLRHDPVYREAIGLGGALAGKARRVADLTARVHGTTRSIAADARDFQRRVPELRRKLTGAASGMRALDRGGARVASGATAVDQGAGTALNGANALHQGSVRLLNGARALDTGNARLLTGARTLHTGSTELLNGARELNQGNVKLHNGALELDRGNGKLLDGARELDKGNGTLLNGAKKLASGLASAEKQIPDLGPDAQRRYAEKLASPVNVETSNAHPAGPYGRGLAPFFIAIALWVFGIVAFLILRPVSGRILASRAGAATVAFAAWLPVLAVGVVAALILLAVLDLGLGLDPVHLGPMIALMALGTAAFSAIVHVLRLAFGAVGDALALVLLMLQLVSCGGLYPVQTLPQPFRAIHEVVPMSYLVSAMRVTVSGGQASHAWRDAAVLGGYLAAALALLVLTVRAQRRWSMGRLKPDLEL